ncbi:MAG: hypothetical protein D6723_13600 [Acidobacteria bacterium]|nr:MAG: hypothetical protein D6723_13600 [Acidobacteriota bacterium]
MSVRIGIIDSGINPFHSHVGNVSGGVALRRGEDGRIEVLDDFRDFIGHGTAVAGVIRQKAPEAELFAIKVFHRRLITSADVIAEAIGWAVDHDVKLINLSLGTLNWKHRPLFERACQRALDRGSIVIAPAHHRGRAILPGALPCCLGVAMMASCSPGEYFYRRLGEQLAFLAHPWPRDLPGVPRERNLHGLSFAVAHMTGFAARLINEHPNITLIELERQLQRRGKKLAEDAHPSPK